MLPLQVLIVAKIVPCTKSLPASPPLCRIKMFFVEIVTVMVPMIAEENPIMAARSVSFAYKAYATRPMRATTRNSAIRFETWAADPMKFLIPVKISLKTPTVTTIS